MTGVEARGRGHSRDGIKARASTAVSTPPSHAMRWGVVKMAVCRSLQVVLFLSSRVSVGVPVVSGKMSIVPRRC